MRVLAHISDLHFGRHSSGIADDLAASLAALQPHLVVVSGDLTQRARHAEFAEAKRFLCRIAQPKLIVPGNHDVPLYNLFDRFLRPLEKYQRYVSPVALPGDFFADEEIAVLGLNTARRLTRKNGRVSMEQIAQIRRVFAPVPAPLFKVLATHHPLGMPGGDAPLELARRSSLALEALASAGVHLLLSGHHHRAASGDLLGSGAGVDDPGAHLAHRRSVLILHAGTAISTRTRAEANSYNLVCIDKGRVVVRVIAWAPGAAFREIRSTAFALRDERWIAA